MDGERSSTSIGTVTYASPEQVSGKVSPTSDQFGAAASLVEVSFGEKLIPIPVAQRYRKQVLSRAFGEYLTFRTNLVVPEPYRSPIRRAMDPDHENRFSSVGAFVQDVAHRHADVVSEGKKPVTIIDLAPKK
jgi:serine/threonine protein kinase